MTRRVKIKKKRETTILHLGKFENKFIYVHFCHVCMWLQDGL